MPTPPTAVTSADLAEGTGTRSFSAVSTQAGDYLVVGIQVESALVGNSFTPSATGVTFPGSADIDSGTPSGSVGRAIVWVGSDSSGGSRTVTITTSSSFNYRARLTVVRGSNGPSGKAASSSAQTVSVTRTGDNSMMFMGVTDWSAGAVGTPTWTPGGTTTASQQGSAATYVFGRWDDSGAAATANHGISTPTYTTPAVAALEMLGTTSAAPATPPTPQALPGQTWLRQFQHRQQIPAAVPPAGGVTNPQSVAGTLTSAGTLTLQTNKPLAGTVTSSGSLVRQTSKALAGTVTSAGALAKQTAKSFAGTVGPAGALTVTKVLLRSFAGSISLSGALTRQTNKPLAGTIGPSGALTRQTGKSLAGTITSSGVATLTKVLLRSFAGTLTSAGALTRQTGKALTGSTGPAGALTRQDRKSFTGAVTSAGALLVGRVFARAFAGTVTSAGALIRRAGKTLAGTVAPAGSRVKRTTRTLLAALTPSGAVTTSTAGPFTVGVVTAADAPGSSLSASSAPTGTLIATSARSGPS